MRTLREYCNTWFLLELVRGMSLTVRSMFRRKIAIQYPEDPPIVATFSWPACVAPLPQR